MRLIRSVLLLTILLSQFAGLVHAQTPTPPAGVRLVLSTMSPEERIGQLFLVSFSGTDIGAESQIYDLITNHHIGGVVLTAGNDNFTADDTLNQTRDLIANLQQMEWDSSINFTQDQTTGKIVSNNYVPLFIGISQEGDGVPNDQILTGLTPLPSEMAIGATWNPEFAEEVAIVRGRELSILGFNLFMGPSLDVLDSPSSSGNDLGTRVFGGDPFWVGEMARAYVEGLHRGSAGKMIVIGKHFPGVGSADRLPEEEVSTVRKSLEELKQIELSPFFAVTGNATSKLGSVDGLLVSHIRYQGFQGNIRATTKPISFDSQALGQILDLPQFSGWHEAGGLIISDNIGTTAVRDFYLSGGGQFSARTAARDAFLAGNDIVFLGNIKSDDAPDNYTTIVRILDFFAQKYREDPAFAQRVDSSVSRILTAKMGLYGSFSISNVNDPNVSLFDIGGGTDVTFSVARNSASLISPNLEDIASVLPLPPQSDDRIVFISDSTSAKQCTDCPLQQVFSPDALETAVLQLYGPQAGNQVEEFRLASYSFENLQALLEAPDDNQFMADDLDFADWVVISIVDTSNGKTDLISRLLRERSELVTNKQLILFSFGAPYYLDTTTISKFAAFYAMYSKQPQFVDVAVRLLFQELTPSGASPVSVPAVDYDIISVMAPDPTQIIPISLDLPPVIVTPGSLETPEPTPIPLFQIGDTIAIRTGAIMDHNDHPVPDGTVVQFSMVLTGEGGGILQQVESVTSQGVARASFGLDKPGLLEIRVASEPAVISEVLQLDVSQSGAVAVTVVVPDLTQSLEPTPEATAVVLEDAYISEQGYPRFSAWMIAMLVTLLISGVLYAIASQFARSPLPLRWSLGVLIGGLLAYNVLAFGLLGIKDWLLESGVTGVVLFVLAGQLLGFTGGWLWSQMKR